MSDLARALYPDLPSAADDAAPASSPAPREGGARSAADAIYGAKPGGIEKARAGIASGVAKPAGEPASAPTERAPPGDWLADAARDMAPEPDAGEPAEDGDYGGAPPHLVDQFNTLAREAGLTPQRSKEMLALHEKAVADVSTQYWDERSTTWERQTRRQFGPRLNDVVAELRPVLDDNRLTTHGFRELLSVYRLGNHPDVVQTLSNWARAIRRGR